MIGRVRRGFDRVNEWLSVWWPLFVSVAAMAVFATAAFVGWTLAEERDQRLEENEALSQLVASDKRAEATRQERLAEAVKLVDDALQERLQRHDADMQFRSDVLLYQIAQLLNRPAGVRLDPVTAEALSNRSPATRAPSAGPRTPPTTSPNGSTTTATTTTTTTPNQRTCDKHPDGPRC